MYISSCRETKCWIDLPLNMERGKKLPSPMNVAAMSESQNTATMNPDNNQELQH